MIKFTGRTPNILTELKSPFFSVIIPTFNRSMYIHRAIKSVLDQTFENWELIIINDASTDNTEFVVSQFQDSRIKYVSNDVNLHKSRSRNKGIEIAKGAYICFQDDDDYYLPNHLDVIYQEILKDGLVNKMYFTFQLAQKYGSSELVPKKMVDIGLYDPIQYLFNYSTPVATPQACISREILLKEQFNPKLKVGQDIELFMRIALNWPIVSIMKYTQVAVDHTDNSMKQSNIGRLRLTFLQECLSNKLIRNRIPWYCKLDVFSYHYSTIGDNEFVKQAYWDATRYYCISVLYWPIDKRTLKNVKGILAAMKWSIIKRLKKMIFKNN